MLEVETDATAVELEQEDLVLTVEVVVRGGEGICLGLLSQTAVVLEHTADGHALAEELLQHVHLVMELAEDNPAAGLGTGLDLGAEDRELGGRAVPVIAVVAGPLALARVDVDLRMERELAEAHQEHEEGLDVVVLESLPPAGQSALDATVEVLLVLGLEVQALLLDLGRGGELREDGAHLFHATVQTGLIHRLVEERGVGEPGLVVTDELEEGADVSEIIDHGRGSHAPGRLTRHPLHRAEDEATAILCPVGLVQNHTVPRAAEEEARPLARQLLVVGDEEERRTRAERLRDAPDMALHLTDVEARAQGGGAPLGHDSLGAKKQGGVLGRVLDDSQDLHGLAQTHLITQQTARRVGPLTAQHPLDGSCLVRLVIEAVPECNRAVSSVDSQCHLVRIAFKTTGGLRKSEPSGFKF